MPLGEAEPGHCCRWDPHGSSGRAHCTHWELLLWLLLQKPNKGSIIKHYVYLSNCSQVIFSWKIVLKWKLKSVFPVFKAQFYTADILDLLKSTAGMQQLHTWEGMPGNQLLRKAKLSPQHSHFIFVKVFQWFYYFTLKNKRKKKKAIYTPAHISKQNV